MAAVRSYVLFFLLLSNAGLAADTAWVRLYDGVTQLCLNRATDICVDPQGFVYVCGGGEILWPGNSDMFVAAYSADGRFLGARCHGGLSTRAVNDVSYAMAMDRAGSVYHAGFTYNDPASRGEDISWQKARVRCDTLASLWGDKSFWPGADRAFDIVCGLSGDLYMCGADHRDTMMPELSAFTVMRVDPESSGIIWSRSLVLDKDAAGIGQRDPFPGLFWEWGAWENCATSMAVTEDGDIVVAGCGMSGRTEHDVWVMEFDTAGNRRWSTVYEGGPYDEVAFDVAIAEDRSIYVCGQSESEEDLYDFLVLRLADTGGVTNVYTYNGMPGGDDYATQIVLDDALPQNVYVTGVTEHGLRGFQVMTQKLSHDLVSLWGADGARYGWAGDDCGYDIAYHQHRVYVAGTVSDNVLLMCFSDSSVVGGETLWTYTYDLPDHLHDCGSCVCVAGADQIYLGGECDRIDSIADWSSLFLARLRASTGAVENAPAQAAGRVPAIASPVPRGRVLALDGLPADCRQVELFDAAGRLCCRIPILPDASGRTTAALDVGRLATGAYLLRFRARSGPSFSSKLVVQ